LAIGTPAPTRHRQANLMAQQADMSSDAAPSHGGSGLQLRPLPSAKNNGTCELVHILFAASVLVLSGRVFVGATEMTSFHGDFGIESVEAGSGHWHARIRRASHEPPGINGVACLYRAIGFAWPDRTMTIEDANSRIDRFGPRAARDGTSGIQLATNA
jgi:hypothetical protein